MSTVIPVVLSGGSGTRLWPLSRAMYPKQFIRFFNGAGHTLLGATLNRIKANAAFSAPIFLCNNDHRFLVRDEAERAGIEPKAIILEPVARNTGPAIAVAALAALKEDPDAIIAVMPSDHVVANDTRFAEILAAAAAVAATRRLVLFGIKPTEPNTGYGYIRTGRPIDGFSSVAFEVQSFFEKPDLETAKRYLAEGNHLWNSGIFVLHAATLVAEIERLEPDILAATRAALDTTQSDLGFLRLDHDAFAASPNLSIDYAVMERTSRAVVLPVDIGWSDVGSWSSLWSVSPRDRDGNVTHGDALLEDTTGCYVHSNTSLVATVGVKDLVIVDTPDALLVADKSRAQDVSKIVSALRLSNRREQEQHLRSYRPWGYFETLSIGQRFQVKLLHVKPGGMLSMQMHYHRSEHWVVVQGTAKITIGDTEQVVRENESVYIVAAQWHRLENPGKVPLELIEVQIGTYLGEDDIIRADDVYHRSADETR